MKKFIFLAIVFITLLGVFGSDKEKVQAYGECDQYGVMAMYESYSNSCKCMSGYVFGENVLGESYCVSGTSMCYDKYGYNSTYDSLSKSCECSYGYVWGKDSIGRTACVSPDSVCKDQLGYSARYNRLSDKCECGYGDVISGGKCTDGEMVCHSKHGYYSNYNDSDNACECDSGYTFDDSNQCVKKQNNVYFTLKELDTDLKQAIIKSDYDYNYYLISYGSGCYANSFRRYLRDQIVVNLGTDFDLDRWDTVVLQDDNEVCDVTSVEEVDSNFTLVPEEDEDEVYYYTPPVTTYRQPTPAPVAKTTPEPVKANEVKIENKIITENVESTTTNPYLDLIQQSTTSTSQITESNKLPFITRISHFFKKFFKL